MALDVSIAKRSLVAIFHGTITRTELARFIQLAEALVLAFLKRGGRRCGALQNVMALRLPR